MNLVTYDYEPTESKLQIYDKISPTRIFDLTVGTQNISRKQNGRSNGLLGRINYN